MCAVAGSSRAQLIPLTLKGSGFVDAQGERVTLVGVNVGNWLLLEPWMLAVPTEGEQGFADQHDILTLLDSRFGAERADALLDVYRANWFTERDAANIAEFGMNVIRVPFHYSLLTSDEGPLELRDDAFEWLDRAVELAEGAGLYVILDLHGAPGGQSVDMPSGRVGENKLWTSEAHQERVVWLWRAIADRYKDSDTVIAYDLLNEPYGDFQTDLSQELIAVMDRTIRAVRAVDPETLVFVPGQISGIDFYGDPRDRGWTNTGFTEHFYPGIFGAEERSLRRHARFVACELAVRRAQLEGKDAPFLVGEFNTIFENLGGPTLLAEYFRRYADEGWMTTMWAYRLHRNDGKLPADNWTLVTNAEPFAFDLHGMSYDELVRSFERLGTVPLERDEVFLGELRYAMDEDNSLRLIPTMPEAPVADGARVDVSGWNIRGIGGATIGASRKVEDGIDLVGGGDDVFGRHDSFVFATMEGNSSRAIATDIVAFEAFQQYAKAGVMLRAGDSPGAAHASVHVIPSGEVRMLWRETPGGPSQERTMLVSALPVRIGIDAMGHRLRAWAVDTSGRMVEGVFPYGIAEQSACAGLFVLAHENPSQAAASFRRVAAGDAAREPSSVKAERVDKGTLVPLGTGWNSWGGSNVAVDDSSIRLTPNSSMSDVGAWRDMSAKSDGWQTVTFEARASRDGSDATLEVRTEMLGGPLLTLASETFTAGHMPGIREDNRRWVRLAMTTPTPKTGIRLLFRATGTQAPRGIEIRDVRLVPVERAVAE